MNLGIWRHFGVPSPVSLIRRVSDGGGSKLMRGQTSINSWLNISVTVAVPVFEPRRATLASETSCRNAAAFRMSEMPGLQTCGTQNTGKAF
jgi:hypothetical protein